MEFVSLYFPAQHPVDKGHIQSAAHHVCQQVILPFLVAAGVEGRQRVKGHALSGAQCFQDRIRDARRAKNAVDIAAVDIAHADERAVRSPAAAHVDLVARVALAVQLREQSLDAGEDAACLRLHLFALKYCFERQEAHAVDFRAVAQLVHFGPDAAHDGFTVTGLEQEVAYGFDFTAAGRPLCMKFAGIADRIDALDDGTLRVVDYKTGAPHLEFAGVESLFRGEGKQRLSNILQTLLYAMMLYRTRGVDAEPALYYVRAMNRPDYLPTLDDRETGVRGGRYTLYAERFEELVRQTLAELYDPSVPFRQCEDADTCKFCDFRIICKRG